MNSLFCKIAFLVAMVLVVLAIAEPLITDRFTETEIEEKPVEQPTEEKICGPVEVPVSFPDTTRPAIEYLLPGQIITVPCNIIIQSRFMHGYWLDEKREYIFNIYMNSISDPRLVKKDTKLIIKSIVPDGANISGTIFGCGKNTLMLEVVSSESRQKMYVSVIVGKIGLIQKSDYSESYFYRLHISDTREATINDILAYSKILHIPGQDNIEEIK